MLGGDVVCCGCGFATMGGELDDGAMDYCYCFATKGWGHNDCAMGCCSATATATMGRGHDVRRVDKPTPVVGLR